jgi:hypothetical protein
MAIMQEKIDIEYQGRSLPCLGVPVPFYPIGLAVASRFSDAWGCNLFILAGILVLVSMLGGSCLNPAQYLRMISL